MKSEKYFKNKAVLVTGASMGIGREIALAFAREGATLLLVARSEKKLKEVQNEIKTLGQEAISIPTDVTSEKEIDSLIRKITKDFGRIDILVNNAGKGQYGKVENASLEDFRDVFELNFFSVVRLIQKTLPLLKVAKGKIINISSVVGHFSVPQMSAYCASKHALNALSESLRIELASQKISVLSVYPGITATDFSANAKAIDPRPLPYSTTGRGIPASVVAKRVVRATLQNKKEEWMTFSNHLVGWLHFLFPRMLEWGMKKILKN